MQPLKVVRNTTVQRKEEGIFLFIQSSAGKAFFNLSALTMDSTTNEHDPFLTMVLETWMAEQQEPRLDSTGAS